MGIMDPRFPLKVKEIKLEKMIHFVEVVEIMHILRCFIYVMQTNNMHEGFHVWTAEILVK